MMNQLPDIGRATGRSMTVYWRGQEVRPRNGTEETVTSYCWGNRRLPETNQDDSPLPCLFVAVCLFVGGGVLMCCPGWLLAPGS